MNDRGQFPERIEEEYRVRQRDLSEVVYRPGDEHYFDQVLIELARICTIGEQGGVPDADWGTISGLLHMHVTAPRLAALRGDYVHSVSSACLKARACAIPVYRARESQTFVVHGLAAQEMGPPAPTRGRHRVAA
jgi:hypothetical protein